MTKTMTAEEVAECKSIVREALGCDLESLRDLAAQAARVPGLDADLSATQAKFTGAADACLKLGAQLKQAESERDAARKEAAREKSLRETWAENVRQVELVLGFDRPDGMTLKDAKDRMADVTTLRERVATLEAENEELRGARTVNRNAIRLQQEARATAQARVRELEAKVEEVRRVLAYVRECEGGPALLDEAKALEWVRRDEVREELAETKAALETARRHSRVGMGARTTLLDPASQPPPAPAQGEKCKGCDGKGYEEDVDDDCKGHRFACTSCKGTGKTPAPTPPPGLREAAGPLAEHLRAELALMVDMPDTDPLWHRHDITVGHARAFLAAYDATGGDSTHQGICDNCEKPGAVCKPCRESLGIEESPDAEDAAKYRAAVERIGDGTVFAQTMRAAMGAPYSDAMDSWPEMGPKAREQWRAAVYVALRSFFGIILTPEPVVSETLDKAWVVGVLRELRWKRPDHFPGGVHENRMLDRVVSALGLTLDTPPSGGRANPERPPRPGCRADRDGDCYWADCPQRNPATSQDHCPRDTGSDDDTPPSGPGGGEEVIPMGPFGVMAAKDAPTFARIAPTPTQESQPSTPDVVLERDGVRVTKHSDAEDYTITYPSGGEGAALNVLARALAEAKREAGAITHTLRQYQRGDERDAGETLERLLRERRDLLNQAWKEAAESMRERAAEAAKTARHRVLVTDESFGVYAMACEDIEISIRRLPLE